MNINLEIISEKTKKKAGGGGDGDRRREGGEIMLLPFDLFKHPVHLCRKRGQRRGLGIK
jgi:hypothetical protein